MLLDGRFEKIDTNKPFDWKLHKDNFPHYLEVLITPSGEVVYACPDHKTAMENLAGVTDYDCPPKYWFSMIDWLTELTGCIAVYTNYFVGNVNAVQLKTLRHLQYVGVYEGTLTEGFL